MAKPLPVRPSLPSIWEGGRQLSGMSKSGTAITYAYNNNGLRVQKTVAGATLGVAVGIGVVGLINDTVNAVYYEYSDGVSDLDPGSYRDGYVSRWERLDYAKKETGEEDYNVNAWLYHSEYTVHMYGWYALQNWKDDGTILVSMLARSRKQMSIRKTGTNVRWLSLEQLQL